MNVKLLFVVSVSCILTACTTPYGYHDPAPDTCDGAPGCAVSAVVDGIFKTKPTKNKSCSEMTGKRKKSCDAQVAALKASIENAKRQK